jgi:hypothetical protein
MHCGARRLDIDPGVLGEHKSQLASALDSLCPESASQP